MRFIRFVMAAAAVATLGACDNPLSVRNVNNPDRDRVLRSPGEVQQLVSSQFQQIISGQYGTTARTHTGMLTAAFENTSALANNGLGPRSGIPRQAIDNSRGNPYQPDNFADFQIFSVTARNMSDALFRARQDGFTLGTGVGDEHRLKAVAWFVHGLAVGNLSLVYDSAGVPRPSDADQPQPYIAPLEGYPAVNAAALASLDSALAWAGMTGTTAIPAGWITGPGGPEVSVARFQQIVRSYKARFRASVARDPTERAAVNWALVIADATAGIQADFEVGMNPSSNWDYQWLANTLHFRDANWHQMNYYILGMADVSGSFDAWLATARDNRDPFLIITPDLRLPQGQTRPDQTADSTNLRPAGRRYVRNRPAGEDQAAVGWQSSFYDHWRWRQFSLAGRIGLFPVFTRAESDMLAAEGNIRTGAIAAAATLIDRYRVPNGLPALTGVVTSATQAVPGGASCVPRVPAAPNFTSTVCGNILEAMKWEKRMETAYTNYGAWFFESRGWGDLPEGTAVHWPVPNQELDARLLPIYSLGGVGRPGGAGPSTYGYGTGQR